MNSEADVIIVGAGLAGLVAACELVNAGKRVIILEQEPEASLGGQAYWSFGGLFFVNSPQQRWLGVRDTCEQAWQDWLATAAFDREEDHWPRQWAQAYVAFAAGEKYAWLRSLGHRVLPLIQWVEHGGYHATGYGNSVPRFHITWGTGPAVVAPFAQRVREGEQRGLVTLRFRHRVTALHMSAGVVDGVEGEVLEASTTGRGAPSSRTVIGSFQMKSQAVIVTAGGIGGNHDLVRRYWPQRLGSPPQRLLSGVPNHVDGHMLHVIAASGGHIINADRMWMYPEGIHNYAPNWGSHGIRVISGPSPLWLDARGHRLPAPLSPVSDTLAALRYILSTGYDYSWFLLNQRIMAREFALSGCEQNPDITGRNIIQTLKRILPTVPAPLEAFKTHGRDFIARHTLPQLVAAMNEATGEQMIDLATVEQEILARELEVERTFSRHAQANSHAMHPSLRYHLTQPSRPRKLLDPASGPLIAVRLSIMTRKSLGGVKNDLSARVLRPDDSPIPGLYAAGEVAGFGGGGMHGYRALEGTFLGGCLFSGRVAGRAVARAII